MATPPPSHSVDEAQLAPPLDVPQPDLLLDVDQQQQPDEVLESPLRILEVQTLGNEVIPISLDELFVDGDEQTNFVADLLADEKATVIFWVRLVEEVWRLNKYKGALDLLQKGLNAITDPKEQVPLLCMRANYSIALARKAPKTVLAQPHGGSLHHSTDPDHPESGLLDPSMPPLTKEEYWEAARELLERAERQAGGPNKTVLDVKATLSLARGRLDEASKLYDLILAGEPTHLFALMGRARILFARRSFRPALKAYQTVLSLAPNFLPDPRIGAGLCFWMLGDRERASKAWERSLVVNPSSVSATLLLGLAHLNASKDPSLVGGEEARGSEYEKGMYHIQAAFKLDNTAAAAAGPLATHFLLASKPGTLKLAERVIQFADSRILTSDGQLYLARALHAQNHPDARDAYTLSTEAFPDQLLALLATAQGFVADNELPAATNMYETILRRHPRCIEALVSLASIHTHLAFTYHSVADSVAERKKAKELYDQVLRLFSADATNGNGVGAGAGPGKLVAKSERVRQVARDEEMFVEIARLWGDEQGLDRSLRAYQEASRIVEDIVTDFAADEESQADSQSPEDVAAYKKARINRARLLNNMGVLEFNKGQLVEAQNQFELALTLVGEEIARPGSTGLDEELDAVLTPCTFNRGVVLDSLGEEEQAIQCYEQVLAAHPEYVEAKARLALIAIRATGVTTKDARLRSLDRAHALLKEALTSQPNSAELRALYTYFLIESGSGKFARDFARTTLKDHNKHDVYALCASGMLLYAEARENKDPSKEGTRERHNKFVRAADFYSVALSSSPQCTFAAQGLAISIAENTLGTGVDQTTLTAGLNPAQAAGAVTSRNTRDALSILNKVKDSVNDGAVYVNIGHCHFLREEWERAIENYEMASKRYFDGKSVSTLLYLARSWYHKGIKDRSFSDLQNALEAAQVARELQPNDLSIIFNVAIIQQKGAEILFELSTDRRTLAEINVAIGDLEASQVLFDQLIADPSDTTPYHKELPRQRKRYGQSVAGKANTVLEAQREYEQTEQAKVDRAKQAREAERQAHAEAERERQEVLRKEAESLAEQRRQMREEAEKWTLSRAFLSDDEDDKKEKKRKKTGGKKEKRAAQDGSGGESGEDEDKPKRKKSKPKPKKDKKAKKQVEDDEEDAAPVEMELDEDGEEAVRGGNKRKAKSGKAFKSAEYVDSDDSDE